MKPLLAYERNDISDAAEVCTSGSSESSPNVRHQEQLPPAGSLVAVRRRVLAAKELKEIQAAAISLLCETCGPTLLAWYHPAGTCIGQTDRLEGLLAPADGISGPLKHQLRVAATEAARRNEILGFTVSPSLRLLSAPVPGLMGNCLLALVDTSTEIGGQPRDSAAATSLLMLSSFISEWTTARVGSQAVEDSQTVAALIELVSHVQSSDTADSACQRLADSLQKHLAADKVVVGLCRQGSSNCRVIAVSGGAVVDPFSAETQLVESVLQESLIRSSIGIWPILDGDNRHALLSHQQLAESGFANNVISVPVQTETGTAVGCVLVGFSTGNHAQDESISAVDVAAKVRETERFLRASASAFAGCLAVLQKLADSQILQVIHWARKSLSKSKLMIAGWVASAISVVMLLPFTYGVRGSLELQPVERHYAAAPFAGPLEECLVEPGDVVAKDQLLARMDGREIRWELAEVQANLNKATKERNTQLSNREFGNAAISGHEIQRLEQRAALLSHRDTSLEIRSPADGIVVSGDHREAEGVPLEMGQTLFEIAPLDTMVVELCIPEDDIRHVEVGMPLRIQLDAVPEESIDATIRAIHPRAELRDGENVFVAEADIANPEALLRPGMRGSAKINAGRHALGWNLFHKPAAWLLGWLGW